VQDTPQVFQIAHGIQLAVAPVFLLTGVGSMLAVLATRLARIIDRARQLELLLPSAAEPLAAALAEELSVLSQRARYINRAITLCVICALLVCTVVAALFLGPFLRLDLSALIAWVFVAAMLALCIALLSFLREIQVAIRHLRIGPS
jgi:hypothetical protein